MLNVVQVLSGRLPVHESQSLVLKNIQICEKQCRDENGFKCHTQAESHVRNALLVGEASFLGTSREMLRSLTQELQDPRKHISDFSNQFQRDFLQLLRTSHVEKAVQINHFYQNYIANKEQ